MRLYLLSDSSDICLGMRLAGIEGEVIKDEVSFSEALSRLADDREIGVVIITSGLNMIAPKLVTQWKLKRRKPLLVEIPDVNDTGAVSQQIARYIAEAIGVRVQ